MKQRNHYQQIVRLVSGIARLTNPQHLPVLRRMRISQAQFLVLDALGEAGGPLRMADLAQAARLSDSELTRVVNELEGKNRVQRDVDPVDGRAKLTRMTPLGAKLLQRAFDRAAADLLGVWEDFTHEEWHRFVDYLKRFEQGLRRVRTEHEVPLEHARNRRSKIGSKEKHNA